MDVGPSARGPRKEVIMAVRLESLTRTEQIQVLEEALNLIRTPDRWIQQGWMCQIYDDTKGVYKKEKNGTVAYGYCLEGAINKATVNLFGEDRAYKLGAWDEENGIAQDKLGCRTPTHVISLDEMVIEMYPTELESFLAERNGETDFSAMYWQDLEGRTWEDVTGLIRQKLTQLRAGA